MRKDKIKKILFLRMEHIGDYGLSLPALKALREHYPKAKIDVVVGSWNKEFAEATPYKDRVIIFDNPLIKRNLKYKEILKIFFKDIKNFKNFFKKVNKENYDLLFSLSDRKYNKLFLKFIKAKKKISGLDFPNPGINENKRIKKFLEKNNLGIKNYSIKLNYSNEDKKIVNSLLNEEKKNKKRIAIHALTPLKEKDWPLKNWGKLLKRFEKENFNFYLIGSKDQKEKLNILEKYNKKSRNIAGRLSITQTIYLIQKSNLIVGSDSGPVHWAELTKTPIISLFGPTDSIRWGTSKDKGIVLKKSRMEDITVQEVYKEVLNFLF